mgnify:CR=1 FL=1
MLDAVVISGDQAEVAGKIKELLGWGIDEIVAHVVHVGQDRERSWDRTVEALTGLGM